ncbi:MAG: hypothetical protein OZ922_12930 [Myxococcales bacterium]|nr:hypothetical protein [Myxococcales bacterium]
MVGKLITGPTFALLLIFGNSYFAQAANNCSATCSQTACSVDCTETDLRDAISKANACSGTPTFIRTITFNSGTGCTINMAQSSTTAACTGDFEKNAVCLTGHHTIVDGANKVTFNFNGTGVCQSCSGSCASPQPALFTLKGHDNQVKNFTMQYFPEGIHIRSGDNHTVSGVTNKFICEDAITIDSTAGTGITVSGNTLTGNTTAGSGHTCLKSSGASGLCGLDKAIQVNGGASTISGNTINTIGQPVKVVAGTHTVSGNSTTGSNTDKNVCQAYSFDGGTNTVSNNTISYCKFGIRVVDAASVDATSNIIKNSYVAGFQVKGSGAGKLKGTGNKLKGNGGNTASDCQRGALVVKDNPNAKVDFGGGDYSGTAVIGSVSSGGNIFCQGSLNDIWNITDCMCSGTTCNGSTGNSASVGARNNCFDSLPPVTQDTVPISTRTDSASTCSSAQCNF